MQPSPRPELPRSPYRSTTSSEGSPGGLGGDEDGTTPEREWHHDKNRPGEVATPEQLRADAGGEDQPQAIRARELQGHGAWTRTEGSEQEARGHDPSPPRVRRLRSRQGPPRMGGYVTGEGRVLAYQASMSVMGAR